MVGLMNSSFVSLSKISDEAVVEKILDEWFAKKLDLFLYFGGNGKKCRLSRCISPSLHIVGEKVISSGEEFYISAESPAHSILKFIPDLPLSPHLTMRADFKISRSIRGEYFNYEYAGTALGFWKVVPTQLSRFNNGKYILMDKTSFDFQGSASGAVFVYSVYDEDYLIFNESAFTTNNDLYIEERELNSFAPAVNYRHLHMLHTNEEPSQSRHATEKYNIALYLIMQKVVVVSDGIPIISKLKPEYDAMWDANVSESTLCEWFVKPEQFTDKRQRYTVEKKKGMYLFLSIFCKKNKIKNSKEKASVIAAELNKLVVLGSFNFDVEFTANDVKPWLKNPLS